MGISNFESKLAETGASKEYMDNTETTPLKKTLEAAIGKEIRSLRRKLDLTLSELANMADLSPGMLSKIENGVSSPSLSTLQALSKALNIPVTSFFKKYEENYDAKYVKEGTAVVVERRGTGSGHQYRSLGHKTGKFASIEAYLITLDDVSDIYPLFQHDGIEFLYVLEGEIQYAHSNNNYDLKKGDSLLFDANAYHGPRKLNKLPIRFLSIIVSRNNTE